MVIAAEKAGIPGAAICVDSFVRSARAAGKAAGLPDIRVASYPGAIAIHSKAELERNIRESVFPQLLRLITEPPPPESDSKKTISEKNIVCTGSFEDINDYFYAKGWTDGLPVVPPTEEKVAAFLRHTSRPPDEIIGWLMPALRPATIRSVAVNGVMAGCEPEYMPVLIAAAEAIADPRFHLEDAGSSAGWTPLIILNGPVVGRLGFNSGTGVMRPGRRPNSTVSRFLRLYMRNIAGFIPGTEDMATFGRPNIPVLAENERHSPWEPLSVTRGFSPDDSVITVTSAGCISFMLTATAQTAEGLLAGIAEKMRRYLLAGDGSTIMKHSEMAPLLVMSPVIANTLAKASYTKAQVRQYMFENTRVSADEFDRWLALQAKPGACECVSQGKLPGEFCRSHDPKRLLPLFHRAEELQIVVSGTPERNRFFIAEQVGRQGLATSKRIDI